MNTIVINIKPLPRHWQTLREYQSHIYIGRSMPGLLGPFKFGNPYRIGDAIPEQGITSATPEDCQRLYEESLHEQLRDVHFRLQVKALSGKTLVCWCEPGAPCHGDILGRVADELHAEAKAARPHR